MRRAAPVSALNIDAVMAKFEQAVIADALAAATGNITRAAHLLGISGSRMRSLMVRHNLRGSCTRGRPNKDVVVSSTWDLKRILRAKFDEMLSKTESC